MEGFGLWTMAIGITFCCAAITLGPQAYALKHPEKKQGLAKYLKFWSKVSAVASLALIICGCVLWIYQQGVGLWAMAIGMTFLLAATALGWQAYAFQHPEKTQDLTKHVIGWSIVLGVVGLFQVIWGFVLWISKQ